MANSGMPPAFEARRRLTRFRCDWHDSCCLVSIAVYIPKTAVGPTDAEVMQRARSYGREYERKGRWSDGGRRTPFHSSFSFRQSYFPPIHVFPDRPNALRTTFTQFNNLRTTCTINVTCYLTITYVNTNRLRTNFAHHARRCANSPPGATGKRPEACCYVPPCAPFAQSSCTTPSIKGSPVRRRCQAVKPYMETPYVKSARCAPRSKALRGGARTAESSAQYAVLGAHDPVPCVDDQRLKTYPPNPCTVFLVNQIAFYLFCLIAINEKLGSSRITSTTKND